MISFFHLLSSFTVSVVLCTSSQRSIDWLEVVPHFEGLENYYRQIRTRNLKQYDDSEKVTSPYVKNLLCWNLLSSSVFFLADIEPVDTDMASTYFELKLFHPDIVGRLYEKQTIVEYSTELEDFVYSNRTKLINLTSMGANTPEYVFICLGRNRETNKIVEYYVSEEYNVSHWPFAHVAGRFIIATVDGELKVSYYAEEPATVLTKLDYNVDHLYVLARGMAEIAPTPDVDPLCKLNVNERIQVCLSVLSAEHFDDEWKYMYNPDDTRGVSEECAKWKVVLEDKLSHYEEWMIQCMIPSNDETYVSYYLSRAYSPNKVFVYSKTNGFSTSAMRLDYMCINVRNFE